jgi:dTDP-4-amino-4,6-dideoxygalactose transaminase
LYHQLYYSHNFGHKGPLDFYGLGINAKISELNGAMGLAVFPHLKHIFEERKKVVDYYNTELDFDKVRPLKIREKTEWNYSYYPIILESEEVLLEVTKRLNDQDIFPRRYFYPSLNKVNYINAAEMPVSESIASRIICLPLYVGLETTELNLIANIINK